MGIARRSLVTAMAAMLVASLQTAGAAPEGGWTARAIAPPGADVERLPNGLFRATTEGGYTFTTHGGDPAPDGHGPSIGPGDPERSPVCATGHVQHFLYSYPPLLGNRIDEVREDIRAHVRRINAVLNEAALESGNTTADLKVACDESGQIRVDAFPNTTHVPEMSMIVDAARAAGFDDPDVDYSIFYDGDFPGICGIAELSGDSSPGEDNANNSGAYAVNYVDCWFGRTPMHENGHNQGAVQAGARNADGTGHCTEHEDVMCYPSTSNECPDQMYYDCGFDTYFDAAPEPREWLETHWNIGSPVNRYIVFGGSAVSAPEPEAGLEVVTKSPRRGGRVRMVASLTNCTGREESAIWLERKVGGAFATVAEGSLDEDCSASFVVRADFSAATFRSFWPSPDGESGIASPPRRVRTRP